MKLTSRILKRLGLRSAAWDQEFRTEHWDRGTLDDPIYEVIARYPGSMLEMGCGTGMTPFEAPRTIYTGIDISPVAIAKAQQRNPWHRFEVSTMERYVPDRKYSVVLFRESIYYVNPVAGLLARLEPFLEPGGVFIARICSQKRHADVIDEIRRHQFIQAEVQLATGGVILVFTPRYEPA